ncbi:MAG TPA: sigma-70 family RNA polymerase sigma factor [Candidatus Limnocylindrales bacterium]|nr:sigma-70 family RNA polymerase sigma factor [Candidatus Limnocylindrales bacterium]
MDDPALAPDETAPPRPADEAGTAAATSLGSTVELAGPEPRHSQSPAEMARDQALVEAALAGDLDAFNQLVALYQDYCFGLVFRVVRDREAAADAVQEAFFSAYRNLARFRGQAFRSWLSRIAINAATDILRARKRRPVDPYPEWEDDTWQPPAREEDDPEREVTRRARGRVLTEALARVTEDQRTAILLYDVEGYDYQEIAEITAVSLGTVKSRIHRGRLALREILSDQLELFRD